MPKTRKPLRKTDVWMYTFTSLLAIFFITLFLAPDQITSIGSSVIYGLMGLAGLYGAASVADNGVKGKYYVKDLDRGDECGKNIPE